MLKTRLITASTTPVVIAHSTVAPDSTAAFCLAGATILDTVPITINNPSTQTVYLGGSSISSASSNVGIPLTAGYMSYNLLASDPLFAVTTNATVVLTCQAGRQS